MRASELYDLPVVEIMRRWPQTVPTFIGAGMFCVGCPIGAFHTLAEAAYEHGLDYDDLEKTVRDKIMSVQAE